MTGSRKGATVAESVMSRPEPGFDTGRSTETLVGVCVLPETADETRGSSNLATVPRAGNLSSDTRAGVLARSGIPQRPEPD